jgi:hypothetical protein
MEFGVNTKFVLWLPRAKPIGLEHCQKKLRNFDHHCRVTFYLCYGENFENISECCF